MPRSKEIHRPSGTIVAWTQGGSRYCGEECDWCGREEILAPWEIVTIPMEQREDVEDGPMRDHSGVRYFCSAEHADHELSRLVLDLQFAYDRAMFPRGGS